MSDIECMGNGSNSDNGYRTFFMKKTKENCYRIIVKICYEYLGKNIPNYLVVLVVAQENLFNSLLQSSVVQSP